MFSEPWLKLPSFQAHAWTGLAKTETLAAIAEELIVQHSIQNGDILIGASFGGMVACEITKLREIPHLFLVGSAEKKEEINDLLNVLHPLAKVLPIDWLRMSAGKLPTELTQMFSQAETQFIQTMCSAIFKWRGFASPQTKVFRIHGMHDLIIPPPHKVDLLLEAGHLIAMTRASECVRFIEAKLRNVS